jgi:hypothetical protein
LRPAARELSHFFISGVSGAGYWDCQVRIAVSEQMKASKSGSSFFDLFPAFRPSDSSLLRERCFECHDGTGDRLGPFDSAPELGGLLKQYPWLEEDLLRRVRLGAGADVFDGDLFFPSLDDYLMPQYSTPLKHWEVQQIEDFVASSKR